MHNYWKCHFHWHCPAFGGVLILLAEMNNTTVNTDFSDSHYKHVVFILDALLMLPTIFGNSLILYCVLTYPNLKRKIYGLIANLALADLLIGSILFPYEMTAILIPSLDRRKYLCIFKHSLFTILIGASEMNLFMISMDRYFSVLHPLKYHTSFTTGRLKRYCAIGWSITIILGILPFFGWNTWELNTPCTTKFVHSPGHTTLVLTFYILLIIIAIALYILVAKKVFKHLQSEGCVKSNDVNYLRSTSKFTKNIVKTKIMIVVLGVFALCWSPYCVLVILQTYFIAPNDNLERVEKYLLLLGQANCGLNWIIYGIKNKTMRNAFRRTLCHRFPGQLSMSRSYESNTSTNALSIQESSHI